MRLLTENSEQKKQPRTQLSSEVREQKDDYTAFTYNELIQYLDEWSETGRSVPVDIIAFAPIEDSQESKCTRKELMMECIGARPLRKHISV